MSGRVSGRLYLVYTMVSQYGGDVWAEDNDPTGTVLVVQLPELASRRDRIRGLLG